MSTRKLPALLTVVGIIIAGCFTADDASPASEQLDPARMQAYIQRNFSHISNLTEAVGRMIEAADGGHPVGVTYGETTTGIQGTVLVDVKGDGTDSARADVTITYRTTSLGIAGGATIAITSLTSPNLTGSARGTLALRDGGSAVALSNGSAKLKYPDSPPMIISSANLTVTSSSNLGSPRHLGGPVTILGSADFRANNKSGTIFFESNGTGGWRIRVVSPDFTTFIVP